MQLFSRKLLSIEIGSMVRAARVCESQKSRTISSKALGLKCSSGRLCSMPKEPQSNSVQGLKPCCALVAPGPIQDQFEPSLPTQMKARKTQKDVAPARWSDLDAPQLGLYPASYGRLW